MGLCGLLFLSLAWGMSGTGEKLCIGDSSFKNHFRFPSLKEAVPRQASKHFSFFGNHLSELCKDVASWDLIEGACHKCV